MATTLRIRASNYMLHDCKRCGYVVGATIGFSPLTKSEKQVLMDAGYEVTTNVHGDEIARKSMSFFNSARFELHRVQCHPTRWTLLLGP